ncbi:hypothetical protein [Priestia endophytica]|uniref:Uncharacterized protein n=1 Tax=Priestia endophytica DSM 13796 TaxID=1121089 RepID=A0A1I5YPS5_9BACI|nr:hypothetical protein [Priestia endophytica]KYG33618.1 hypothetical protein AZF06_21080 [Priestia endophytica]SFQ46258.1 hypothetical protein SAMN02745910_01472 [Priestia endophytica DSM 13796]
MSSYNIYQTLCDVVKKAYPEDQYPNNAFTKFFVDIKVKEMKTVHGRYYPKWNRYGMKKAWVKKIPTQSLQKEEAKLLHLTNIKVKVAVKK